MKSPMKPAAVLLLALTTTACVYFPVESHSGKKGGSGSALICHKGKKTMELPQEAANGHIKHGDRYGPC
ncbi:MAG: hypothetical protein M3O62_01805 [Pseudomonadota bacterium]|nr:hypothetical protein [Pseudomonadota bacterium]